MVGRRPLILIPHPDDEVVGCCAAIARARAGGAEVFGAVLTTGVPAAPVLWPWQRGAHPQRVARRRQEAQRAAELLQITPLFFHDVPTRELRMYLGAARELLLQHAARVRADALWAPAYEGGHQDHDAANFLASTLRAHFEVWEFSEYNFGGGKVRSQEFLAPNGSEKVIALSHEESSAKERALAVYESEQGNLSYVRTEKESFRPLAEYDYSRPPHSGKLFYQRFQWVPYHPRVDYTQPQEVCRAITAFTETRKSC